MSQTRLCPTILFFPENHNSTLLKPFFTCFLHYRTSFIAHYPIYQVHLCFHYSSTINLFWRVHHIPTNWMVFYVYFCLFICGWVDTCLYCLFLWLCSEEEILEVSIAFSSMLLAQNCFSWPLKIFCMLQQLIKAVYNNIYLIYLEKINNNYFNLLLLKYDSLSKKGNLVFSDTL